MRCFNILTKVPYLPWHARLPHVIFMFYYYFNIGLIVCENYKICFCSFLFWQFSHIRQKMNISQQCLRLIQYDSSYQKLRLLRKNKPFYDQFHQRWPKATLICKSWFPVHVAVIENFNTEQFWATYGGRHIKSWNHRHLWKSFE